VNAVPVMRRLEAGGIPHEQAKVMAEVLTDEIESTIVTKDFVKLTVEEAKTDIIKRFTGIIVVQTLGLTGVFKLLVG
jgi:hypothetical protein